MEKTLAILKPDCIKRGLMGKVIDAILEGGFAISAMKMVHMTHETATAFYDIHRKKPFFPSLIVFMSSDKCVALVLEKTNAVATFRKLLGVTDPEEATAGTIRRTFGENQQRNTAHGSDSIENAAREIAFFFTEYEIIENQGVDYEHGIMHENNQ
ncbi:nucleoside-diphosphate kinase [bacterium]|nr:nucleoside-diphosphate kinase [bacterium]